MPAKSTTKKSTTTKKQNVQPDANIGLVGHVDHGKTTLTEQLSGRWTDTHSEELKKGITIRLGYANVSIYEKNKKLTPKKETGAKFKRKISLVDAPGHESLMATMLSGTMIMDGAIILIAANEECPQPQTREHITALKIAGVKNVVVIQNKVDLVSKEEAEQNYKSIKEYLKGTPYKDAPVIPMSAYHGINIDVLLQAVQDYLQPLDKKENEDPQMLVARSFDINTPGTKPGSMKGGILGGAMAKGKLKKGDEIEISPEKEIEGKPRKLYTKVEGLMSGDTPVDEVKPGGSVAIMTSLDPAIVKSDNLVGTVVGLKGKLPPSRHELKFKIHLLDRVVGTQAEEEVKPIAEKEMLMLNVNSGATVGVVSNLKKGVATCNLKIPVCAETGSYVTISRRVGNRFRLVGYGEIQD